MRFRVIACNNDGVWNNEGALIAFSVAPAWYQTNTFRALCIVAGLFVLWTIQGMRERAARIEGKLTIVSSATSGTEVTVVVPGGVVFRKTSPTLFNKVKDFYRRKRQTSKPN